MNRGASRKSIAVLDFGGQYAHLIASRIRRLGAYTEIVDPRSLRAATLKAREEGEEGNESYAGLIFSGGPASVYDKGALHSDPELLDLGLPVLGICYGHQLLIRQTGGDIRAAAKREYGPARIRIDRALSLFQGEEANREATVWMSHSDEVISLAPNFTVLGATADCPFAAVANLEKRIFGLQFHPEVHQTERGSAYLLNFIRLCGVEQSWSLQGFLKEELQRIERETVGRKIFFLLSGGVDSTVAFALLTRVLPQERLIGLHIDTGFMRRDECRQVATALAPLGVRPQIVDAAETFFHNLTGVSDPEEKRQIIGKLFLQVQEEAATHLGLDPKEWLLGQGTIYPDTIESGDTNDSRRIKTHHNRAPALQALLKQGAIIEPLRSLYKDEVRELGRLLSLPASLVERHPFPGPGLAVRCLCSPKSAEKDASAGSSAESRENSGESRESAELAQLQASLKQTGFSSLILPLRSVGVQGDRRSYRAPALLLPSPLKPWGAENFPEWGLMLDLARQIPNLSRQLNRALLLVALQSWPSPSISSSISSSISFQLLKEAFLTPDRIALLQQADAIAHQFQLEKGIYDQIWQFPVVLLPLVSTGFKASVPSAVGSLALRPIVSTDAMTASVYQMEPPLLLELAQRLLSLPGCSAVFYDLTSKPPATIEWE